jgi:hypothetical protein
MLVRICIPCGLRPRSNSHVGYANILNALAGVTQVELVYKMTNALLTTVKHIVKEATLVEKLALSFQKLEVSYSNAGKTTDVQFDSA